MIKKLIENTFADNVKEHHYSPEDPERFQILIKCLNGESIIKTFKTNSLWIYIKDNIEEFIKDPFYPICLLCDQVINFKRIYCEICGFIECKKCSGKNFEQSKGIHICFHYGNTNDINSDENTSQKSETESDYCSYSDSNSDSSVDWYGYDSDYYFPTYFNESD